jgi:hypothetical protein
MSELILSWYALGWVAAGLDFAVEGGNDEDRIPLFVCFLMAPFAFSVNVIVLLFRVAPKIRGDKQYLWRKP